MHVSLTAILLASTALAAPQKIGLGKWKRFGDTDGTFTGLPFPTGGGGPPSGFPTGFPSFTGRPPMSTGLGFGGFGSNSFGAADGEEGKQGDFGFGKGTMPTRTGSFPTGLLPTGPLPTGPLPTGLLPTGPSGADIRKGLKADKAQNAQDGKCKSSGKGTGATRSGFPQPTGGAGSAAPTGAF